MVLPEFFIPVTSPPPYVDGKPPEYAGTASQPLQPTSSTESEQHYAAGSMAGDGYATLSAAYSEPTETAEIGQPEIRRSVEEDGGQQTAGYDNVVCATTDEQ